MHELSSSARAVRPTRLAALGRCLARAATQMRLWAKPAVAASLMIIVVSFVDWRESLLLLGNLRPAPMFLALLLLAIGLTLSTLKWQVLLAVHAVHLPFLRLLRYYWIGSFFSNFALSTIGGDVVRLLCMHKYARPTVVGASIVVERASGLTILVGLAAFGLWMRPEYYLAGGLWVTLWLLVAGLSGALGLALVLGSRVGRWLGMLMAFHRLVDPLIHALNKMALAVDHYRRHIKPVTLTLILSILFYAEVLLFDYSVILSVGGDITLLEVILIAPLIALVSLVPISVNAIGVAEGAFVLFYTQAGLTPEEALAAAVLRRMVVLCYSVVGGVIWLREKPRVRSAQ
jgi:glycosyltransferase 2 family protein